MRLVDTSAWVAFLRRRGEAKVKAAVARLLETEQAAYTCPIRFELLSGVRPAEGPDLELVFRFSRHVPFEQEDWAEAAALERGFRAQGLAIPRNDLLVATVAIRAEVPVVCRDAHFEAMRQVLGTQLQVEQV
jgi:predicted nucleic acid-binding protein